MFALKYALKSILRRKQKNLITSFAIALAVAVFIGSQAGGDGVIDSMAKLNLDNIGNIDITITDPTSPNSLFNQSFMDLIDPSDPSQYPYLKDVNSISPRIIYSTSIYASKNGLIEEGVTVRGIQPGDTGFGEFEYKNGAEADLEDYLAAREVVISDLLADELELLTGDEIQFSIPNGLGNSTTMKFSISAIYDETDGRGSVGASPKDTNPQLYINLNELKSGLHPSINQSISEIAITFDETVIDRSLGNFDVDGKSFPGKKVIKSAIQKLENMYSNKFPGALVFSARVSIVEEMSGELVDLTGFLTMFGVMLIATALLLIVNVQNMVVDDRKNQTAILRAMGSSVSTIFAVFVLEAAIVGIIGALVGFILGYIVSIWMLILLSESFGVKVSGTSLDPNLIIVAMVFGVVLSIITAVLPSLRAARQGVANALRGIKEPEKPRKGFTTLLFGIILLPLGLISATQVGNVFDEGNWSTYENQVTMLLGFGLTLAGLGMLLTLVLSRRLALSISGLSMWGLGALFTIVGNARVKSGNPSLWFMTILLFLIVGGTLLVTVNYEWLMNSISRMLFLITGLRAISQVTTKQMIGKKSRGVLVVTILTIILFLIIVISIYTTTMRIGAVDLFDRFSDDVDLVVSTDNAFNNTAERIRDLDPVIIEEVFAFRRTILPIYLVSPSDPNLDVSTDIIFMPIIEIPEDIINPDGDWGEDSSLQISFRYLADEIEEKTGHSVSAKTSEDEHRDVSKDIFAEFYDGNFRTEKVEFGDEEIFEDQTMVISNWVLQWVGFTDFIDGATIYLQSTTGEGIPTYIGALTWFDMMGTANFPLFGNSILVTPSIAAQLPFDVDYPNLFLVRSTYGYHEDSKNDNLGKAIETDLNDLKNNNSFSSINNGNLIGASATVVKEVVKDYWFQSAAVGEAFATYATLGLVIGGLGLMIIAFRSVSERSREIGMMRSIGFSRKSVVIGVLIEMVTVSVLGLIVGFINGVMFAVSVISSDLGQAPLFPIGKLSAYVFGVLVLGILAGVIPGYNASKVPPSQALRYTG
jgi:ABC-type lipoprotein release transport system permease subunit